MRRALFLRCLLLVCLSAVAVWAQPGATPSTSPTPSASQAPVTVNVTSDKQVLEIGQSMRVHVEISNAEGAELKPVAPDKWDLKPFELQDSAVARLPDEGGRQKARFTLRVSSFEEGEQTFPAITLDYTKDGENASASSQPFAVLVKKVAPAKDDKPGEIRDLKRLEDSPFPRELLALIALLVAVCLYGLYRFVRWCRRPKPVPSAPALPPFEWAKRELDRIEREKIWDEGKFDPYYDQLTLVLRHYLGWRFQTPLLERTTSETLDALKDRGGFDYESWRGLRIILEEADLVKFARLHPPVDKAVDHLKQARSLLEKFPPCDAPAPKEKQEVKSA